MFGYVQDMLEKSGGEFCGGIFEFQEVSFFGNNYIYPEIFSCKDDYFP